MQYLGFYLAVPVFLQFIRILYPQEMPQKMTSAGWAIGILSSLTVLLTPAKIYSWLMVPYEIYTIRRAVFCHHRGPGQGDHPEKGRGAVLHDGALENALAEAAACGTQVSLPSFVDEKKKEELLQMVGGDSRFLIQVLEAFLRDMPGKLAGLETALAEKNAADVRLLSHGMKSSGLFIGAASFAVLCKELEDLADTGTLEGAGEIAEKIREEFLIIQKELKH